MFDFGKPREIGQIGEDLTCQHIAEKGYFVFGRNYSCPYGEIDVIAMKDDILAFIEVKTRKKDSQVSGFEAVTKEKQEKIIKTALHYLEENQMDMQPRFDVSSVVIEDEMTYHIDYLESAFTAEGY